MKKILDMLTKFLSAMAEARAASHLARMGRIEEAKNVYK